LGSLGSLGSRFYSVNLIVLLKKETEPEFNKTLISARHAGLDPASKNFNSLDSTGFRVKPGMTKKPSSAVLHIPTQSASRA
jgi:hypothetical protein